MLNIAIFPTKPAEQLAKLCLWKHKNTAVKKKMLMVAYKQRSGFQDQQEVSGLFVLLEVKY